ncbi:hypothetical protein NBRC116592_34910 [Colwellia sp. KU-HH00111]|uniref:DUF3592 domain-containing protein n=1 Tax=Colwellia sp. KU-HH00111 TaxID=3127652 RepID=UPI00310346E8
MKKNQIASYAFCLGILFTAILVSFLLRVEHFQNWPKIEAQILEQELFSEEGGGQKVYLEYQYIIMGNAYFGSETIQASDFYSVLTDNGIKIAFNPDSPETSIVYASIGYPTYLLICCVLMFFVMSLYFFIISQQRYEQLLKRYKEQ